MFYLSYDVNYMNGINVIGADFLERAELLEYMNGFCILKDLKTEELIKIPVSDIRIFNSVATVITIQ